MSGVYDFSGGAGRPRGSGSQQQDPLANPVLQGSDAHMYLAGQRPQVPYGQPQPQQGVNSAPLQQPTGQSVAGVNADPLAGTLTLDDFSKIHLGGLSADQDVTYSTLHNFVQDPSAVAKNRKALIKNYRDYLISVHGKEAKPMIEQALAQIPDPELRVSVTESSGGTLLEPDVRKAQAQTPASQQASVNQIMADNNLDSLNWFETIYGYFTEGAEQGRQTSVMMKLRDDNLMVKAAGLRALRSGKIDEAEYAEIIKGVQLQSDLLDQVQANIDDPDFFETFMVGMGSGTAGIVSGLASFTAGIHNAVTGDQLSPTNPIRKIQDELSELQDAAQATNDANQNTADIKDSLANDSTTEFLSKLFTTGGGYEFLLSEQGAAVLPQLLPIFGAAKGAGWLGSLFGKAGQKVGAVSGVAAAGGALTSGEVRQSVKETLIDQGFSETEAEQEANKTTLPAFGVGAAAGALGGVVGGTLDNALISRATGAAATPLLSKKGAAGVLADAAIEGGTVLAENELIAGAVQEAGGQAPATNDANEAALAAILGIGTTLSVKSVDAALPNRPTPDSRVNVNPDTSVTPQSVDAPTQASPLADLGIEQKVIDDALTAGKAVEKTEGGDYRENVKTAVVEALSADPTFEASIVDPDADSTDLDAGVELLVDNILSPAPATTPTPDTQRAAESTLDVPQALQDIVADASIPAAEKREAIEDAMAGDDSLLPRNDGESDTVFESRKAQVVAVALGETPPSTPATPATETQRFRDFSDNLPAILKTNTKELRTEIVKELNTALLDHSPADAKAAVAAQLHTRTLKTLSEQASIKGEVIPETTANALPGLVETYVDDVIKNRGTPEPTAETGGSPAQPNSQANTAVNSPAANTDPLADPGIVARPDVSAIQQSIRVPVNPDGSITPQKAVAFIRSTIIDPAVTGVQYTQDSPPPVGFIQQTVDAAMKDFVARWPEGSVIDPALLNDVTKRTYRQLGKRYGYDKSIGAKLANDAIAQLVPVAKQYATELAEIRGQDSGLPEIAGVMAKLHQPTMNALPNNMPVDEKARRGVRTRLQRESLLQFGITEKEYRTMVKADSVYGHYLTAVNNGEDIHKALSETIGLRSGQIQEQVATTGKVPEGLEANELAALSPAVVDAFAKREVESVLGVNPTVPATVPAADTDPLATVPVQAAPPPPRAMHVPPEPAVNTVPVQSIYADDATFKRLKKSTSELRNSATADADELSLRITTRTPAAERRQIETQANLHRAIGENDTFGAVRHAAALVPDSPFNAILSNERGVELSRIQTILGQVNIAPATGDQMIMFDEKGRPVAIDGNQSGQFVAASLAGDEHSSTMLVNDPESVLHEATHALLDQGIQKARAGADEQFSKLWADLSNVLYQVRDAGPSQYYGLSNTEEFIAELVSNQRFRDFLKGQSTPDAAQPGLYQTTVKALGKVMGAEFGQRNALSVADDTFSKLLTNVLADTGGTHSGLPDNGSSINTSADTEHLLSVARENNVDMDGYIAPLVRNKEPDVTGPDADAAAVDTPSTATSFLTRYANADEAMNNARKALGIEFADDGSDDWYSSIGNYTNRVNVRHSQVKAQYIKPIDKAIETFMDENGIKDKKAQKAMFDQWSEYDHAQAAIERNVRLGALHDTDISDAFKAKRTKLLKIINDDNSSEAQVRAAYAQLVGGFRRDLKANARQEADLDISGQTTSEAKQIIADLSKNANVLKLDDILNPLLNDAYAAANRINVASGRFATSDVNTVNSMGLKRYRHLMKQSDDEDTASLSALAPNRVGKNASGTVSGFGESNKPADQVTALTATLRAANIRNEQNRAVKPLFKFAGKHKEAGISIKRAPAKKLYMAEGDTLSYKHTSNKPYELSYFVGGRQYMIGLSKPRVKGIFTSAKHRLDSRAIEADAIQKFTRLYGQNVTVLNPGYWVRNVLLRDVLGAGMGLMGDDSLPKKVRKDLQSGAYALKATTKAIVNTPIMLKQAARRARHREVNVGFFCTKVRNPP